MVFSEHRFFNVQRFFVLRSAQIAVAPFSIVEMFLSFFQKFQAMTILVVCIVSSHFKFFAMHRFRRFASDRNNGRANQSQNGSFLGETIQGFSIVIGLSRRNSKTHDNHAPLLLESAGDDSSFFHVSSIVML